MGGGGLKAGGDDFSLCCWILALSDSSAVCIHCRGSSVASKTPGEGVLIEMGDLNIGACLSVGYGFFATS